MPRNANYVQLPFIEFDNKACGVVINRIPYDNAFGGAFSGNTCGCLFGACTSFLKPTVSGVCSNSCVVKDFLHLLHGIKGF